MCNGSYKDGWAAKSYPAGAGVFLKIPAKSGEKIAKK